MEESPIKMSDDNSDDLEDITEEAEEEEEDPFIIKSQAPAIYRFEIQGGHVFNGTIKTFEEQFFVFSPELSEEEKIAQIAMWAGEQNWTFKSYMLH